MRKRVKYEPPKPRERICRNCKRWIWVMMNKTGVCRIVTDHGDYKTTEDSPAYPNSEACRKYVEL